LTEFAILADRLGFKSDNISALKARSSDREIARRLLKARKPGLYRYDNLLLESHVEKMVRFVLRPPRPRT